MRQARPAAGDDPVVIQQVEVDGPRRIGHRAFAPPAERALDHVYGYAAGIDLTRRDIQAALRKEGKPWDMAKGFDQSGPIGEIAPAARIGHPARGAIVLEVDGTVRQDGDLAMMIWSVAETIAHLSRMVRLEPGDLVFTGTPEGVGRVDRGARLAGRIEGVGTVETRLV